MRCLPLVCLTLSFVACKRKQEPQPREGSAAGSGSAQVRTHDAISRADFNRYAVRLNLPVYWIADANSNKSLDVDEVAPLLFYGSQPTWTANGAFTKEFETAYDQIVDASKAPPLDASSEDGKRRTLVREDLDAGRPTLVRSDFSAASAEDKAFVKRMLGIADLIDDLYETQNGARAEVTKLPADPESRSLFRRNRGPDCEGPVSSKDPACSALPGAPKHLVDIYPAEVQAKDTFCKDLQDRKDGDKLMDHFNVVRGAGDDLKAVPYNEAYADKMKALADALNATAAEIKDPAEQPLVAYLKAAAGSFSSNNWTPADEAWAKMGSGSNSSHSKWYVRVAPDETYWEPCAQKAGFHLSFARINQGSKQWQEKLVPVQQDMEAAIAKLAGAPYKERKVTFHLPDFIDIIVNAGDDRDPLGATIGQSLPNWGPVANEGRGRTVAMVNINTDPDSREARQAQAESVLDAASAKLYPASTEPGLLSTILHEATHNLGPAHEYKVKGKTDDDMFGGPIASMMEELKAQTGALYLLDFLRQKGLIDEAMAQQAFVDSIIWAFGHISQGMYTADHSRKAYGNLAAIQIGFLIDNGALTWDANATAANGTDKGAFTIHADKLVPAANELMKQVAGIKARGDKAAAEKLIARYVDAETVVPHKLIAERFLRHPKPSFVYSVVL
ncbi:MAG TPA: hypothetical protein VFS15_19720 [Kofleriaceae bacterium]|nr:hypothetical protein [Kofleriaceae bacterium]